MLSFDRKLQLVVLSSLAILVFLEFVVSNTTCGQNISRVFRGHSECSEESSKRPMIYFILTASIHVTEGEQDAERRKMQYTRGLERLHEQLNQQYSYSYQIVIVENNGQRSTFLDELQGVDAVVYTNNNQKTDLEKGEKELADILTVVNLFSLSDEDLIVKMTGRYYLESPPHSPFMDLLRQKFDDSSNNNNNNTGSRAIVKFGSYMNPIDTPTVNDCVTGLIMLPVNAIKEIPAFHIHPEPIEWAWAQAALAMVPQDQLHAIEGTLGIHIAPGGGDFFLI